MKKQNKKGVTLIEALVGVSILTIMIFGVYGMYNYSLKIVREKGWREQALSIANEEIETFRGKDYDDLPCAETPTITNKTRNGINYEIKTNIKCVDDPFDDVGANDDNTDDYKKVKLEVGWGEASSSDSVIFVTTFAPAGEETNTICEGGTLKINVFNSIAGPVEGATVYIKNNNLAYENSLTTNSQGIVKISCLTEDLGNNYEITVSKTGYSTAQTCPTGTGTPNPICPTAIENSAPTDPHLNIIKNQTTEKSFGIDLLSTLDVKTITQTLPDEWTVNDTTNDGNIQNMPALAIGPNSTYHFFWEDNREGAVKTYGQKFNSSKVAQWPDWSRQDVRVSEIDNQNLPDTTVDQLGNSYVAWYKQNGNNHKTYIHALNTAGSEIWYKQLIVPDMITRADRQFDPKINAETNPGDVGFIYATYKDNTYDNSDIYSTQFTEGGTQGREIKINDDATGNTQTNFETAIEPDSDDLYIVWQDDRNGDYDIYAQKINSYYLFSKEVKISIESDTEANTVNLNGTIQTLSDGKFDEDNLLYYDPDNTQANDSFVFIDSNNNNDYDDTEIKISIESDTEADTTNLNNFKLYNKGFMQYHDPDPNNANDSYLKAKIWDYNTSMMIDVFISIESDTEADTTHFNNTTASVINGNLVYYDPSNTSNNDSYLLADINTNNLCDSWNANVKINNDDANEQSHPDIAILTGRQSNAIYVVWQDNRNGNYDIYMSKFTQYGERMWANDVRLTTLESDQTHPTIGIDNVKNSIYVGWVDKRNGNPDIYVQKFNTSGTAQWDSDLRINNDNIADAIQGSPQIEINNQGCVENNRWNCNGDFYTFPCESGNPVPGCGCGALGFICGGVPGNDFCPGGSNEIYPEDTNIFGCFIYGCIPPECNREIIITWHDNDTGDYDIRAAKIFDPNPTTEAAVQLIIHGNKTIGKTSDNENIYKFNKTFTTDENGEYSFDGATAEKPKLEWDSYTLNINGYSYNLLRTEPPLPLNIEKDSTNSITVTVE